MFCMSAVLSHPNIVVIGYVWPEPASSAAGENMFNLLMAFVEHGWQVTFMTAASDSSHKADLAAAGIRSVPIALNCSSFDTQLSALAPDAVVFDRFMIEEQFSWRVKQTCPQAVRILNTEDLHSLRHTRQQAVKKQQEPHVEFSEPMVQREIAAILRCDLSLIISAAEYRLLTETFAVPPAQLLSLPLLISAAPTHIPPFSARQGFMFIGNFRHAPNWDAVLQLKEQWWPAIRQRFGHAQLAVYGAYPAKKVTNLHNPAQGFHVHGWVKDARAAISAHRVMLAPLRFGAGIKGKLIGAMQCGTPSITTTVATEGIHYPAGWPGAVADTVDDMARQAVELHNQQTSWNNAAARAALIIDEQFATRANQQRLVNTTESLVTNLTQHRQGLFLQQLLWHETLRSTQYMSQWIEAKNATN